MPPTADPASLTATSPSPGIPDPAVGLQAVRAVLRAASVLERASSELSLSHYRVLSSIAAGEERASHIAAHLAVGKPTISAAVNSLCQRGLLARFEVEGDQRAATLRLTHRGRELLAAAEEEMQARLADLCRRTPDGERLVESLVWLGRAVDERRAERRAAPTVSGPGPAPVGR